MPCSHSSSLGLPGPPPEIAVRSPFTPPPEGLSVLTSAPRTCSTSTCPPRGPLDYRTGPWAGWAVCQERPSGMEIRSAGLARASVWNRLPSRWVFRPNLTKHLRDEEGPLRDEYHFFSLGGGGEISRLAPKVSHPNHVTHVFVNAGGLLPFVETDRPAPSPARCQRPAPPAQRAPSLAASPGQDRAQIGRRCR